MPEPGRFLNADTYPDTGTGVVGTNMFAYCNNNPVMLIDPDGTVAFYYGYRQWDIQYNKTGYAYGSIKIKEGSNEYRKARKEWIKYGIRLSFATLLFPDGAAFYRYYRSNKGGTYTYDYSKAIRQDSNIKKAYDNALKDLKAFLSRYKSYIPSQVFLNVRVNYLPLLHHQQTGGLQLVLIVSFFLFKRNVSRTHLQSVYMFTHMICTILIRMVVLE